MNRSLNLIIGGMKCGSTTAFDLLSGSDVCLTAKESSSCDPSVSSVQEALDRFERCFGDSDEVYDVSTRYTMLPLVTGVAARAKKVADTLDAELRVTYLVRDRFDRLRSHLEHDMRRGVRGSAADLVRGDPRYVSFGLYAAQLSPWLEIEPERINVVATEGIAEFFRPRVPQASGVRSNSASDDIVAGRTLASLLSSELYVRHVRPLVPRQLKDPFVKRLRRRTSVAVELSELSGDLLLWLERQFAADDRALDSLIADNSQVVEDHR